MIGQLIERKAAALRDLDCAGERLRITAEQPRHLVGRFQITVGMPFPPKAGIIDGEVVTNKLEVTALQAHSVASSIVVNALLKHLAKT